MVCIIVYTLSNTPSYKLQVAVSLIFNPTPAILNLKQISHYNFAQFWSRKGGKTHTNLFIFTKMVKKLVYAIFQSGNPFIQPENQQDEINKNNWEESCKNPDVKITKAWRPLTISNKNINKLENPSSTHSKTQLTQDSNNLRNKRLNKTQKHTQMITAVTIIIDEKGGKEVKHRSRK